MPLVSLTVRHTCSRDHIDKVLTVTHEALKYVGVPANDLFQRVLALPAEHFRYDTRYPDVQGERDENFTLIEILWSVGRSVKVKKMCVGKIMETLPSLKINPENVMVVFRETQWENWSFAGGRFIHT